MRIPGPDRWIGLWEGREYAWVPEETFAAKRAEILEKFLTRERLYTTDLFFAKYEQRARANLRNSLRRLKP